MRHVQLLSLLRNNIDEQRKLVDQLRDERLKLLQDERMGPFWDERLRSLKNRR